MDVKLPISVKDVSKGRALSRREKIHLILRRLRWGLGIAALLLIGIFFLVPFWISNEQGHAYVLGKINAQCQAKIAIGDWSVGWFRGTELRDVRITGRDGKAILTCGRIKTDLSLWGLLWKNYDVGTCVIDALHVNATILGPGQTSLDELVQNSDNAQNIVYDLLTHLRGSLQSSAASIVLTSSSTNQVIDLADMKMSITIASLDAPFHVQIASGTPGSMSTVAINATVPALQSWHNGEARWAASLMALDMDASATNLPTGLVCSWLGFDTRWEESIGKWLRTIRCVSHGIALGDGGRSTESAWSLFAQGNDPAPAIDIAGRFRTTPRGLRLVISDSIDNTHAECSLRLSDPLKQLLAYVNPLLADVKSANMPIEISLSDVDLSATDLSSRLADISATARFAFPDLMLVPSPSTAAMLGDSGNSNPLVATFSPLRMKIADGAIRYDNLQGVINHRRRVSFAGSVTLDGRVHLMATIPDTSSDSNGTLQTATAEIPIGGTVQHPQVGTLAATP